MAKTKKQPVKFTCVEKTDLVPAGEYVFVFGEKGSTEPHSSTLVTAKKAHHPNLLAQQVGAMLVKNQLNTSTTWCRVTDKEFNVQVHLPWHGATPAESARFALEGQTFWQKQLAV